MQMFLNPETVLYQENYYFSSKNGSFQKLK